MILLHEMLPIVIFLQAIKVRPGPPPAVVKQWGAVE